MKHVSPYATFVTGLFMIVAAIFYTLVISDIFPLADMDRYTRLVFMIPSALLTVFGFMSMVVANIRLKTHRFCRQSGEWVPKH
jgi:hypothetical protein